jgi:steroid delta-isomerase-like uncharacterized protein
MIDANSAAAVHTKSPEQTIADLIAAWNTHDLDRATAFFAADYVGRDIAQLEPQYGPTGIRRALASYFQALPDVSFALEELIAADERVVVVWTARGTHRGALMNIPASGRGVTVRGVSAFTLHAGQITKADFIWDVAGLLRAIGLLPEL